MLVVRSHRQELDQVTPILALDPCICRTIVQHLGLHPCRRDVWFPEFNWMRGRLLHEEVLVDLDVADLYSYVRAGSM